MKREELEIYWGSAECVPDRVYEKEEADSVMDAMEQRIKELESQCTKYQAELMNNDPALNDMPKWISVKDRLPICEGFSALIIDARNKLYGIIGRDCNGVLTQFTNGPTIEATHWMPLPPPPTTEEK